MLMNANEWMMLMLMQCKCKIQAQHWGVTPHALPPLAPPVAVHRRASVPPSSCGERKDPSSWVMGLPSIYQRKSPGHVGGSGLL